MADNFDNLANEVEQTEGIYASLEKFIQGLVDQIKALKEQIASTPAPQDNQAKIDAFATRLDELQKRMIDAIMANAGSEGSMGGAQPNE